MLLWFPAHIQYGRNQINCNLCRKVFDSVKVATTCFFTSFYTLVPASSGSSLETTLPTEPKCLSLPRHLDLRKTLVQRASLLRRNTTAAWELCLPLWWHMLHSLGAFKCSPHSCNPVPSPSMYCLAHTCLWELLHVSCLSFIPLIPHWDRKV